MIAAMPSRLRLALVPAAALAALTGFDLWRETEAQDGIEVALDLAETALLVGAMVAIALAAARIAALDARADVLRDRLDRAMAEGAAWRASRAGEIAALGEAIGDEFRRWGLSPAEADVAGLLLKGAAMKEIAAARATSEATIRQQAQAIYRKAGLSGRAELQAYFLDSLFGTVEERRATLRAVT